MPPFVTLQCAFMSDHAEESDIVNQSPTPTYRNTRPRKVILIIPYEYNHSLPGIRERIVFNRVALFCGIQICTPTPGQSRGDGFGHPVAWNARTYFPSACRGALHGSALPALATQSPRTLTGPTALLQGKPRIPESLSNWSNHTRKNVHNRA